MRLIFHSARRGRRQPRSRGDGDRVRQGSNFLAGLPAAATRPMSSPNAPHLLLGSADRPPGWVLLRPLAQARARSAGAGVNAWARVRRSLG